MNSTVKLVLDIVMGAVIPIVILNTLNEPLGIVTTYIIAALVPVTWVFIDLLLITKRFNFVTSYIGAFAIVRGVLAFWFVDGIQFALKDTVGSIFTVGVFWVSIVIEKPIVQYFLIQGMGPESPQQEKSLRALLAEPKVYRSLVNGTKIVLLVNLATGVANFILNFQIVVADFGTTAFNQQVAQVNAITRVVLALPEYIGIGLIVILIRRAMYYYLPEEDDQDQDESDFWELLQLRESQAREAQETVYEYCWSEGNRLSRDIINKTDSLLLVKLIFNVLSLINTVDPLLIVYRASRRK
ncbi:MAG: VC0807 family protein [Cyanobacteria bacterium J06634_5]